ncbi:MAG TPA: ERAP1-like C-terminal domain-containing protein, partial [Burkholderiaceae bacterium]|nr:ERAP1-like C-terminal domain-containing protein [Burkholderiaceae bacterium]
FFPEHPEKNTSSRWNIPITVQSVGNNLNQKLMLDAPSRYVTNVTFPVLVNSGQSGYGRVRYDQASYSALSHHFADFPPIDQIGILQDAWALGQVGLIPVTVVLDLVNAIPTNADPLVWAQGITIFSAMDSNFAGSPLQKNLRSYARSRLVPVLKTIGWDGASNETPSVAQLRPKLLETLSQFDDQEVIEKATKRFADILSTQSTLGNDSRQTAEAIVARHADAALFDILIKRIQAADSPLTKHQQLFALATVNDPILAGRLLEFTRGADIPAGEQPEMLEAIGQNHPDQTWAFVQAHLKSPELMLDDTALIRNVPLMVDNSIDPLRINELQAYGEHYLPVDSRRAVESTISKIRLNIAMTRYQTQLRGWLSKHANES